LGRRATLAKRGGRGHREQDLSKQAETKRAEIHGSESPKALTQSASSSFMWRGK
jgi:hypothetical protein